MSNNVTEYLSRLLNKTVDAGTEITLSSAQRARLHAWLTNNQFVFDEAIISKRFTVNDLLNGNLNSQVQRSESGRVNSPNSFAAGHIASVGIDIQKIDELFPNGLPMDPKSDPELTSIFTMSELSYAQSKDNPIETLAGIFAAKEAIQKTSIFTKSLNEIEVLPDESGRPDSNDYVLSISHSGEYAISIAIKLDVGKITDKKENLSEESLLNNFIKKKKNPFYEMRFIDFIFIGMMIMLAVGLYRLGV